MHDDELSVDADLVRRLLADQLPDVGGPAGAAGRPRNGQRDVPPRRRPRGAAAATATWAGDLDREREWLPVLRERFTLGVPEPVAHGRPTAEYPLPWAVYRWIPGDIYADGLVADETLAAVELARFVRELRSGPVDGVAGDRAPTARRAGRGDPGGGRRGRRPARHPAVLAAWDRALAAPPFAGDRVWVHTDLLRPNLLVRDGRLVAVIDFGAVGAGDPAADVIPAWTVFGAAGRARYREHLDVDDATWDRARGYALTQAALIVPYYRETNPSFTASAVRTIGEIVADRPQSHT